MSDYSLFNISGMISIRRERVSGYAMAVMADRSAKDATETFDYSEMPISEIGEDETVVVLFNAMLKDAGTPEIAVRQISKDLGGPDMMDEPALLDMIGELLSKF